jgi:hypothetical protein
MVIAAMCGVGKRERQCPDDLVDNDGVMRDDDRVDERPAPRQIGQELGAKQRAKEQVAHIADLEQRQALVPNVEKR